MSKQSGMTLIGMILTMAVIILGGIILMRVIPVYIENYTVIQSINSLKQIPREELSPDPVFNVTVLKKKLTNQLYINGITIPKDKIRIKPIENGHFDVFVTYQVKKPLIGNVSLIFDFDESREVTIEY